MPLLLCHTLRTCLHCSINPDFFDFSRYTTLDTFVADLICILISLHVYCCAFVSHSVSAMVRILASIYYPELFSKLILIGASPRFLNDGDYHGGFEQSEIDRVFAAMKANYQSWVNDFAPLVVDADVAIYLREIFEIVISGGMLMPQMLTTLDARAMPTSVDPRAIPTSTKIEKLSKTKSMV